MNILVVDDEADVRPLFEQRFRREIRSGQFSFSFASSGEQALSYLHEHDDVGLVLSDINMPGMSGLELLQRMKQPGQVPAAPAVLMLTAYGDADNYAQAKRMGANDLLTKPVNFALLKEKLVSLDAP